MAGQALTVREIQKDDVDYIINYWLTADIDHLKRMGVDETKVPNRPDLTQMLMEQIHAPLKGKKSYCIIWLIDGVPSGHSNINKIVFGEEAYMHLHLWHSHVRQQGLGTTFVQLTLPYFFLNFELKHLYSEPYALNPAPNKTLSKAGFEFVKQYVTIPGSLNFEQEVNLWRLTYQKYRAVKEKL